MPEPRVAEPTTEEEEAKEQQKLLQINETSVVLAVFSADVDVTLDERMKRELLRATKKNAPQKMRYELIYVRGSPRSSIAVVDISSPDRKG